MKAEGVNTEEFEEFLNERNATTFREHLICRFLDYQSEISKFFITVNFASAVTKDSEAERLLEPLFPDEKQQVLDSLLLDHIRRKLSEWIDRSDIPQGVRNEMRRLSKRKSLDQQIAPATEGTERRSELESGVIFGCLSFGENIMCHALPLTHAHTDA
jgi:hypothetical protein